MEKERPFSKLEEFFDERLKMKFYGNTYPREKQKVDNRARRFYVKLGREIIWDFPKDFISEETPLEFWSFCNGDGLYELVHDYMDTPIDKLLKKKFKKDTWKSICQYLWLNRQEVITVNYKLIEIFIVADKRLDKDALLKWAARKNNPIVDRILNKRFEESKK